MTRDFQYYPKSFEIPTLYQLREEWSSIPYNRLRDVIVIEHQYLKFHLFMINNTRHVDSDVTPINSPLELSLTVRAGALKAALLVCASIIEGGLLAHSLKRKYKNLSSDSRKKTFGNIICIWKENSDEKEFSENLEALEELCNLRNHIHLEKIADSEEKTEFYNRLLEKEKQLLQKCLRLISWVQSLQS